MTYAGYIFLYMQTHCNKTLEWLRKTALIKDSYWQTLLLSEKKKKIVDDRTCRIMEPHPLALTEATSVWRPSERTQQQPLALEETIGKHPEVIGHVLVKL